MNPKRPNTWVPAPNSSSINSGPGGIGGAIGNLDLIADLLRSASGGKPSSAQDFRSTTSPLAEEAPGGPNDPLAEPTLAMIRELLAKWGGPIPVGELAKRIPGLTPDYLAQFLVNADAAGDLLVRKLPSDGVVVDLPSPRAA